MAAYRYEYRVKGLQKTPVEVVGQVFEDLEKSDAGLTPQTLVDASRDESAPLHGEFEWNDDIAAEEYRKVQAQKLICNVVVVTAPEEPDKKESTRAFVSAPGGNGQYVAIRTALSNEVFKAHLLMMAKREAAQFVAKYRMVKELCEVVEAIDRFLDGN